MKNLSALILVATIACGSLLTTSANAGVPVIDVGAIAQAKIQVDQMNRQFQQFEDLKDQLKGNRNIGKLFDSYNKYLPKDMKRLMRDYESGNWQGLSKKIAQLKKAKNLDSLTDTQSKVLNDLLGDQRFKTLENAVKLDKIFDESNKHFDTIQKLMDKVDDTEDAKEAADLSNRIQAEIASLQLQAQQIKLMEMRRNSEKDLQQEKNQQYMMQFSNPNNTKRIGRIRAFE